MQFYGIHQQAIQSLQQANNISIRLVFSKLNITIKYSKDAFDIDNAKAGRSWVFPNSLTKLSPGVYCLGPAAPTDMTMGNSLTILMLQCIYSNSLRWPNPSLL